MSEQKHSTEPWKLGSRHGWQMDIDSEAWGALARVVIEVDGTPDPEGEANARRIVACVNSLAGIETAEIEAGVVNEMVKKLRLAKLCIETIGETDGSVEREIDAVLARLGRQS